MFNLKTHLVYRSNMTSSHTRHPSIVACVLQESLMEDLERLQKQQIIVPLGMNETLEWCISFILVSKANGKVQLCLDTARLNKALIRLLQRVPTLNNILLRLEGIIYLSLFNAGSGFHNLQLNKKSSYLTMFSC